MLWFHPALLEEQRKHIVSKRCGETESFGKAKKIILKIMLEQIPGFRSNFFFSPCSLTSYKVKQTMTCPSGNLVETY